MTMIETKTETKTETETEMTTPKRPRRGRVAVAAITLLVIACSTVPLTGRSRLNYLSNEQALQLGAEAYPQLLEGEKILRRGPEVDQVMRVGDRIRRAAEEGSFTWPNRGTFEWEFTVVDNDEVVNAWALPGGKVAVYTGILRVAGSDAGLATVMGHEVAHAIAGHGGERMTQSAILDYGRQGAQALLGEQTQTTMALFDQAWSVGSSAGVLLPFSRKHESEADEIGLMLMASAGYDPREAVAFWERMSGGGGSEPWEFLSTHPNHDTRVKRLRALMPEALEIYRGERDL